MKSSARNIGLTSLDDLFSTEESRADEGREKVWEIPLAELHPFRNHPFKVRDDERMLDTAESIREHGVLVPAIARPREEGGYELIAGHRRKRGCGSAGKQYPVRQGIPAAKRRCVPNRVFWSWSGTGSRPLQRKSTGIQPLSPL